MLRSHDQNHSILDSAHDFTGEIMCFNRSDYFSRRLSLLYSGDVNSAEWVLEIDVPAADCWRAGAGSHQQVQMKG